MKTNNRRRRRTNKYKNHTHIAKPIDELDTAYSYFAKDFYNIKSNIENKYLYLYSFNVLVVIYSFSR